MPSRRTRRLRELVGNVVGSHRCKKGGLPALFSAGGVECEAKEVRARRACRGHGRRTGHGNRTPKPSDQTPESVGESTPLPPELPVKRGLTGIVQGGAPKPESAEGLARWNVPGAGFPCGRRAEATTSPDQMPQRCADPAPLLEARSKRRLAGVIEHGGNVSKAVVAATVAEIHADWRAGAWFPCLAPITSLPGFAPTRCLVVLGRDPLPLPR